MSDYESQYESMVVQQQHIIYKMCYVYALNDEELKDYFQEVLIALWNSYANFRQDSKISTWIYRISLNTCISYKRKNKRHEKTITLDTKLNLIDNSWEEKNDIRALHSLIEQLNPAEKSILLLWLEKKSYEEIAEILTISKENVGVRLSRIKSKLKRMSNK